MPLVQVPGKPKKALEIVNIETGELIPIAEATPEQISAWLSTLMTEVKPKAKEIEMIKDFIKDKLEWEEEQMEQSYGHLKAVRQGFRNFSSRILELEGEEKEKKVFGILEKKYFNEGFKILFK